MNTIAGRSTDNLEISGQITINGDSLDCDMADM